VFWGDFLFLVYKSENTTWVLGKSELVLASYLCFGVIFCFWFIKVKIVFMFVRVFVNVFVLRE
jgi:hypothetical protein